MPRSDRLERKTVIVTYEFKFEYDAGDPKELVRKVAEMTDKEIFEKADPDRTVECEGWII